jgi:hypothetical protein
VNDLVGILAILIVGSGCLVWLVALTIRAVGWCGRTLANASPLTYLLGALDVAGSRYGVAELSDLSDVEKPLASTAAQLLLMGDDHGALVLDCLVSIRPQLQGEPWVPGVPMTIRARPRGSAIDERRTLDDVLGWTQSATTVEITLSKEHGRAIVLIEDGRSQVTLDLERSEPYR